MPCMYLIFKAFICYSLSKVTFRTRKSITVFRSLLEFDNGLFLYLNDILSSYINILGLSNRPSAYPSSFPRMQEQRTISYEIYIVLRTSIKEKELTQPTLYYIMGSYACFLLLRFSFLRHELLKPNINFSENYFTLMKYK